MKQEFLCKPAMAVKGARVFTGISTCVIRDPMAAMAVKAVMLWYKLTEVFARSLILSFASITRRMVAGMPAARERRGRAEKILSCVFPLEPLSGITMQIY